MGKGLGDLRALMKDHWERDQGLAVNAEVCLERFKLVEYQRLEAQKADMIARNAGAMALPDTSEIDRQMAELLAEMDGSWVTLHFRAISDPTYRRLLRESAPDGLDVGQTEQARLATLTDFQATLTAEAYTGCTYDGVRHTAEDVPFADWQEQLSFADLEPVYVIVFSQQRQWAERPQEELRPKS